MDFSGIKLGLLRSEFGDERIVYLKIYLVPQCKQTPSRFSLALFCNLLSSSRFCFSDRFTLLARFKTKNGNYDLKRKSGFTHLC